MSSAHSSSKESWRPILEALPGYEVSDRGRVRSSRRKKKRKPKLLVLRCHPLGYQVVNLVTAEGPKTFYLHRLVARAFIGEIPDGFVVNHRDRLRSNNSLSNLEICCSSSNWMHANMLEWTRAAIRLEIRELLRTLRDEGVLPNPQSGKGVQEDGENP